MTTDKKVALVTGGSRGIGLGIASALAAGGFDIAINGRRDASQVGDSISKLQSTGAKVMYFRADICDRPARAAMILEIQQNFGRLDVLVNNAGVGPEDRTDMLDAPEDNFDRLIAINLKGFYFLTQAVARWMVSQRKAQGQSWRGCIINISSVSAAVASPDRADYCIAQSGIAMTTRLWATRLAEFGIDVYEIRPGIMATDVTAALKEKYDRLIAAGLTVEQRWGTPQDVGRAAIVLARGDISYATGQVLHIDGGLTIAKI